jgi:hypothetical protein
MAASSFKMPSDDAAAEDNRPKQSSRHVFTLNDSPKTVLSSSLLLSRLPLRCRTHRPGDVMRLPNPSTSKIVRVCLDGYVRMTFEVFTGLEFTLRKSWEDGTLTDDLRCEGIEARHAGYCEWQTDATQAVSMGWAWFERPDGRLAVAPGGISTNVMLVTPKTSYDLGQAKTEELLQAWLDGERWQPGECASSPAVNRFSS